MKKTKWSIIWALLLSLAIPISSNAQSSSNPSPGATINPPKSSSELILNNMGAILTGVAALITSVAALITAVYSRNKSRAEIDKSRREIENSKAEIQTKIGLRDLEEPALRSQLLEALSKDKGEFLEVIKKLGSFVTSKDLNETLAREFGQCEVRFTKILRDPKMEPYIQTQCPFVTKNHLGRFDLPLEGEMGYQNFARAMRSAFDDSEIGQRLIQSLAMKTIECMEKPKYHPVRVQAYIEETRELSRKDSN